ncbi:acetyltransferase [Georgenia yuyongxinii]
MPRDRLVVVGASGFGRETLDVFVAATEADPSGLPSLAGVLDDAPSDANLTRLRARQVPYLGALDEHLVHLAGVAYVIGVGDPHARARLAQVMDGAGAHPFTLVHPSATVGTQVRIGAGSVVCAGVLVSTNVSLGRHVHLNPGAIVGHDTVLADHVSVNPGAVLSGECTVKERALVGAGATVLQGLTLGPGSLIGAGACVTRAVPAAAVATGVPARWAAASAPAGAVSHVTGKESR